MLASQFHITGEDSTRLLSEREMVSPTNSQHAFKQQQVYDDKEIRKAIINYTFSETPLSKRQKTTASIDLV